jgi:TolA-binding protein
MSEIKMIGFRPAPHQIKLFDDVKKGQRSEKLREIVDEYLSMSYCAPEKIKQLEQKIEEFNEKLSIVNKKLDMLLDQISSQTVIERESTVGSHESPQHQEGNADDILHYAAYFGSEFENQQGKSAGFDNDEADLLETAKYFGAELIDL